MGVAREGLARGAAARAPQAAGALAGRWPHEPRGYSIYSRGRPHQGGLRAPRAYYSTVFDQLAGIVWRTIRAFDRYSWVGTGIEAEMEDGKAGDAVGGLPHRYNRSADPAALLGHSDGDRFYSCHGVHHQVEVRFSAQVRITQGARNS